LTARLNGWWITKPNLATKANERILHGRNRLFDIRILYFWI
jgi:hypothetical protein